MNKHHVCSSLGIILTAFGVILLSPIAVALWDRDYFSILPFAFAALNSVAIGLLLQWLGGFLVISTDSPGLKVF